LGWGRTCHGVVEVVEGVGVAVAVDEGAEAEAAVVAEVD